MAAKVPEVIAKNNAKESGQDKVPVRNLLEKN
jgi:hypothetical protein